MDEPFVAAERVMLDGWLDLHRVELLRRCAGLTPNQLAERSVPPSPLSLLGLVRHLTHPPYGPLSLCWIYVHMIREYAGHIGHADLLRERIDGVTFS
ncbi:MAG: DUF664 domain-containing protein [Geodermatophilaceae bacterium]|nr:DUF664 domain-containing protein [Geodermatophilaceae bacterium]